MSPLTVLHQQVPAATQLGLLAPLLRASKASGSLFEACVSFDRCLPNRFGFHNLRHSLASFLVDAKCDPKTVQDMLRHADVKVTLGLYSHSKMERHVEAQGMMLEQMGIRAEKVN
jgi:integrase